MAINDIALTSGMRSDLFSLTNNTNSLSKTQERLATGKVVNTFADNPANFSAAQANLSRAADLAASKDAVTSTITSNNIAQVGYQGVTSLLQSAQGIADLANNSGDPAEQAGYAATYQTLIYQAAQMANDAGIGSDVSSILPSSTLSDKSSGQLEASIGSIRSQSAASATSLSGTSIIQDFTSNMINILQSGADNLTLGDMNEEGAAVLSQQTQQQLGTVSLRISSKAAQSLLRLF